LDLEIALNGVSAKIQPCGLFSRAKDKMKLSDDVIKNASTWSAWICPVRCDL